MIESNKIKDFQRLIQESAEVHGHLCPGQVIGVRMALLGCKLIGLDHPRSHDQIRKLIVFVEMDRCTADAVAFVTGVKLGRRSLKFVDYGIMAASFLNLESQEAFRIISTEEARDLAQKYAPEYFQKTQQQLMAYQRMPDKLLFRIQKVKISLTEFDLPGPTKSKVTCFACGQVVRDQKTVYKNGFVLCKPCAQETYFKVLQEVDLSESYV